MPSLPAGILPADLDWDAVDRLASRYELGVPLIDRQHRMLFAWCVEATGSYAGAFYTLAAALASLTVASIVVRVPAGAGVTRA